MVDQNKLMNRIKHKTEADRLTISSMMYFVAEAAVFAVKDLASQHASLHMAWLEGAALMMKPLADLPGSITIAKVLKKEDKDAMLFVLSDNSIIVVSAVDPVGRLHQMIRPQPK
ncbi:MAG TPA: hypothetical protein VLH56_17450 [Dissulfurispiraceae bacterium]|nr:hypothetical protein [Dissulfurispiraceae bacterium]